MAKTLDVADDKLIEDVSEWATNFIATRFQSELTPEFQAMVLDIIVEAFAAGAGWAEQNMLMAGEIIAAKVPRIEVVR